MKLPIRLENAITKLYTAFHEGKLEAEDCQRCAVGNMCDGNGTWWNIIQSARPKGYDSYLVKCKMPLSFVPLENDVMKATGYSSVELAKIESLFMLETIEETKETQFKGLCAVVEYLCELDSIPNVMDYTKLFETENNKPKYELSV
jgi:hypothetical protein